MAWIRASASASWRGEIGAGRSRTPALLRMRGATEVPSTKRHQHARRPEPPSIGLEGERRRYRDAGVCGSANQGELLRHRDQGHGVPSGRGEGPSDRRPLDQPGLARGATRDRTDFEAPASTPCSARTAETPRLRSSSMGRSLVVRWTAQTEEETDVGGEPFPAQVPDARGHSERGRDRSGRRGRRDRCAEQGRQGATSGHAQGRAPPVAGRQQALPREQAPAARPSQRTLQACTSANASNQATELANRDPIVKPAIRAGTVWVVPAIYNVPNGRVRLVAPPVSPSG